MKKIFLFAAAICAAISLSAETISFKSIKAEKDWAVTSATKNSSSTATKLVYDVDAETEAVFMPVAYENIEFSYKNSQAKEKIATIALGDYFEFGGKNGVLTIYGVKIGSSIKLTVAGKSDKGASSFVDPAEEPNFPDGAVAVSEDLTAPAKTPDGYSYVILEYTATSDLVKIKEFAYGYRIQSLEVEFDDEEPQSISNKGVIRATKAIRNGEIIIMKNGVAFNILGARE